MSALTSSIPGFGCATIAARIDQSSCVSSTAMPIVPRVTTAANSCMDLRTRVTCSIHTHSFPVVDPRSKESGLARDASGRSPILCSQASSMMGAATAPTRPTPNSRVQANTSGEPYPNSPHVATHPKYMASSAAASHASAPKKTRRLGDTVSTCIEVDQERASLDHAI